MKQLYIAHPSEQSFLVNKANRPGTLSNILDSVLGMLPGFHKKQNSALHNTKEVEDQEQATPEASMIDTIITLDNSNNGKNFKTGNTIDNVTESNAFLSNGHNTSNIADFCANVSAQNDTHNLGLFPMHTKTMFPNPPTHNEMLSHYNCILIGCFKDIFQSVDTSNLFTVLQTLKELNFILANRAPELAAHYGLPLEPQQVSTEEVPNFVSAYLNRPTANSIEHSSRGWPRNRGNQHYRHIRPSSPVPRYNCQTSRSDTFSHSNRARPSHQHRYSNRDRHHSYSSVRNQYSHNPASNPYQNISNMPHNANNMHPLNTSELIGSLQSQIIDLQSKLLQQSTLNSIKIFNRTNKTEFSLWAQNIENAAKLCNLDTLHISLSKLQGAPLRSAKYLEGKETNSGKRFCWSTLKQHLTSNYSKIPYNTNAINAYDTLQQGTEDSTEAYLHRVQDILECIHHTNDMSSISAIGINHTKILTGHKDGKLCNKLAETKAKKWTNMVQVLQDITDMAVNFKWSRGYSLPSFEVNHTSSYNNHKSNQFYRSSKLSTKETQQPNLRLKKMKCWHCQGDHFQLDCTTVSHQSSSLQPKIQINKGKQHKLIKSFWKRFQNRKEKVNEITTASESDSSNDQLN